MHPCIEGQLLPTILPDGTLNVVTGVDQLPPTPATHSGYPMSPFIQLIPAINQDARINACFVQREPTASTDTHHWRPSSPWDNPVLGWVVVNYADSALQFFTVEGIFYTSVRFGGPDGIMRSQNWLPFSKAPTATKDSASVSDQLVALVNVLADPKDPTGSASYLMSLWNTIEAAIQNMPFAAGLYSSTANAIVGKPLALVNAGWSLELAQPPLWAQHTLPAPAPVINGVDLRRKDAADAMGAYKFKVKIGDVCSPSSCSSCDRSMQTDIIQRDRPFDGVVAY